jgi:tRNA modification GTPase
MLVEATLDFPEDIDFLQKADAAGELQSLQTTLATVMQRAVQGRDSARGHQGGGLPDSPMPAKAFAERVAGAWRSSRRSRAPPRDKGVQIDSDRRRALHVVDRRPREALDEVEK